MYPDRIIIFALFWMSVGMLLMLFIQYKIIGLLIAVTLLLFCFFVRPGCR